MAPAHGGSIGGRVAAVSKVTSRWLQQQPNAVAAWLADFRQVEPQPSLQVSQVRPVLVAVGNEP